VIQPQLDDAALAALEEKYRMLVALRRRKDQGGENKPASLAETARRYPGALRELDRNSDEVLQSRLQTVCAVRTGQRPCPDWLQWIFVYHKELDAALAIKRGEQPGQLRDAAFVRLARKPPQGRLAPAIIARVAQQFGVSPHTVADTLFPPRREAQ